MKPTAPAIRQVTLFLMLAMGVLSAPVAPVAQAAGDEGTSCDQWNTKEFFQAATVEDVTACMKQGFAPRGVNQHGQSVLHTAAVFTASAWSRR